MYLKVSSSLQFISDCIESIKGSIQRYSGSYITV